jgi:NAD(P)-dependent dehydrogenase (short-subunit alcohol dehydrogenase family)
MSGVEGFPAGLFATGLFADRIAVVTGGGKGIGRATALAFARLGARVVLAGRDRSALDETRLEVESAGAEALVVPTDIRDVAGVERLRDRTLAHFGTYDFVVNNAGGQFLADPFGISDNGWRAVVDLNLNGTWNMCSRFVPHLLERRRGAVVNVVHVYSFDRGAAIFAHSGAARAGVVNLTRSLAPYLEAANVTVNAVAPGVTLSPSALASYGMTREEVRSMPSRSRLAEPDDIAAVILFLCSPGGRIINGAAIVADGTDSLQNWPTLDLALDRFAPPDGGKLET